MTKYSQPAGNMTSGGSDIIPLSREEALEWCQQYSIPSKTEAYFSDMIEDA